MKLLRLLLLFLLPVTVFGQNVTIAGKVSSAETKTAIGGASVFLSNSSFGTSTKNDGSFTLSGLRAGQYTLVVTAVGYESNTQTITVNTNAINLDIALLPKITQLKEVKISGISKSDKKAALARFKEEFIGTDANAEDCEIINPEVLSFDLYKNKTILEASASDFLIIENNALGYRIKYLLKSFKSDLLTSDVSFAGSQVFEELDGSRGERKQWYKKRDAAYYGSAMHFYRSLQKDSLTDAGFKIYRLHREFNSHRPSDDIIQQNIDRYKKMNSDSVLYWIGIQNGSHYAKQKFVGPLTANSILQRTDRPGLFALSFPDHLYVVYTKKWETAYFKDVYRIPNDLNYTTTIVSYTGDNHLVLFDTNGTIIGDSPLYEGTWSKSRLSTLLPVDYTPHEKQP
jgi:hypothetical protein